MITAIAHQAGHPPTQVLADTGYCSDENLTAITDTAIDAYIATRKRKHGERSGAPSARSLADATALDRMTRKLQTKTGAAVYAARKRIVEPL